MTRKVDSRAFYAEYSGHKVQHLQILYSKLRESSNSILWTAGDSSLDNKYWFWEAHPAVPGPYAETLDPPQSNADITYWLNYLSHARQNSMAAINTAVEASTVNERTFRLRPQDRFLRDHIQSNDTLVVSVGGNDIALVPCPCTIASVVGLICCTPMYCLEHGFIMGTCPLDDCCCGCGASLASCGCACPPCFGYMNHLFGTRYVVYGTNTERKRKKKEKETDAKMFCLPFNSRFDSQLGFNIILNN